MTDRTTDYKCGWCKNYVFSAYDVHMSAPQRKALQRKADEQCEVCKKFPPPYGPISEHVARIRGDKSYRQLAKELGIDQAYLWRLETGERTDPKDEVLEKLGLRRVVTYEPIDRLPAITG